MADKHELHIEIDDDGNVTIKVEGLKGDQCLIETRKLEEALGMVRGRENTHEMYEQPVEADLKIEKKGG